MADAEYITTMLSDDDEDDNGRIEALDELLCEFEAKWAEKSEAARHQRLQTLLTDVTNVRPADDSHAQKPLAEKQLRKQSSELKRGVISAPIAGDESSGSIADGCQQSCAPVEEAVIALAALCSEALSPQFLQHVLCKHHGQITAAGLWLIDCENLETAERHWRHAKELEQAASEQDAVKAKAERARLFARFDLQNVTAESCRSSSCYGKKAQRQAIAQLTPWQGDKERKDVRFRDGRIVSTRGERFIAEQTKEEYDGGARGKVKSKGKRGVGWS